MKLWFRLLLGQLFFLSFFGVGAFFLIYVVVDLSMHGMRLLDSGAWLDAVFYYFYAFSMHLYLFIPIAFLFSVLKTLFDLMYNAEIIALQMAGLSKRKILTPCFWCALFWVLCLYCNEQWIVPKAGEEVDAFYTEHLTRNKKGKSIHLSTLPLEDETEVVFQNFDAIRKEFFDFFWILSPEEIWYAKWVRAQEGGGLEGLYVDRLGLEEGGRFAKKESYDRYLFHDLCIDLEKIEESFIPFQYRSISTLLTQVFTARGDKSSIAVHLHYKLAMPLFLWVILLGVAPYALRFGRTRYPFAMTALSLFAVIAWIILLDGLVILGENQVFPAGVAIWAPFGILFGIAVKPFSQLS